MTHRKTRKKATKKEPRRRAPRAPARNGNLNAKQSRFVEEYLIDLNATQAAIRAGYSPKTAKSQGQRLLTNVDVAKAIDRGADARSRLTGITADQILAELDLIGRSDIRHYQVDDKGNLEVVAGVPDSVARAVSSIKRRSRTDADGNTVVEVEIKLWEKPAALKMVGQHLRMFIERHRHEHTGKGGGPVEHKTADRVDLSGFSVPELREYRRLVEKANADEVLDDEELRVYGGFVLRTVRAEQ